MLGYLVVFVGAGVGGTMRHFMNIWIARYAGTHFPYHTLAINITGSMVIDSHRGELSFREGPVFTHLLLADEVYQTNVYEPERKPFISFKQILRSMPKPIASSVEQSTSSGRGNGS